MSSVTEQTTPVTDTAKEATAPRVSPLDLFIEGARKGWNLATGSMLPNIVMAFVVIEILKITKALDVISAAAAPVMALWDLPGDALVVLCSSVLSTGGGIGVAGALFADGRLSAMDITIMFPGIALMGAMVQYFGRVLGTADANKHYFLWHIVIDLVTALISMWFMRFLLMMF